MHGRPRRPAKAEDPASKEKEERLRSLQLHFLHAHQNKIYTKEALETSAKLLEINPEVYTAWNYRKIAIDRLLESETDSSNIKSILDEELRVVETALRQNPKSYGAWHHRKWVLSKGFSSLDHEFRLLDKFLKIDSRNFHGWNYRRFVAALKNATDQEEMKYMTDKINANFSNYSAWHNRSVLLSKLLRQKADGYFPKEKVIAGEYELVDGALFTDPDDQSGWFYYLWLLNETTQTDIPLLTASWPPSGAELMVAVDADRGLHVSSPCKFFFPNVCPTKGAFPLILHFNRSIEEVNNTLITVKSIFFNNEDLIWRPLSTNKKKARSWVCYFTFPANIPKEPHTYSVEVYLMHPLGLLSLGGTHNSCPGQFGFTLTLQFIDSKVTEGETDSQMLTWETDEFCSMGSLDESFISFFFPSDQVKDDFSDTVASKWQIDILDNEITLFEDLLSYKIGKLTLARLLMAHDMLANGFQSTRKRTRSEEVLKLFNDLRQSDTPHARYYKDQYSLAIIDQVTSTRKALMKHCWRHKRLQNSILHENVCLHLNNLALSQVGFFDRLVWVQMLDLSHNELQTIEGLEALQLLKCLNLSNNKFRSFTALEPLSLLNFLSVLDISHNEIGGHSIDTTRYLCSSPLSNGRQCEMNLEELASSNLNTVHYWEAILIFKDLQLIQLDIAGNPSYDDNFRRFLEKIIPSLKWLNGESVY